MRDETSWRPVILMSNRQADREQVARLKQTPGVSIVDAREAMLVELTALENPALALQKKLATVAQSASERYAHDGVPDTWAWYPWKNAIVSILPEEDFVRVRTSRNKFLITDEEQDYFRNLPIGIAGLSVGYSIALAIVLEGGGKHLRLADNDTLDLSNLNRLPYSLDDIGLRKSVIAARRLYEIDPYLELVLYSGGLGDENIIQFCDGISVVIDEVDNLGIKSKLREQAAEQCIPLIMATDNEETGMIDIERYDLDPNTKRFLGLLPEHTSTELTQLTKQEAGALIQRYLGEEHTSDRMRKSLDAMGVTNVSWPQLGGTALVNGGAVAYAIRSLITHPKLLATGRYAISLPNIFGISK